jgi:hypothetical protein
MADKTFKVNPGEEIEIAIRRRRRDAETILGNRRKRGIIDPFSRDEFLPRRLTKETGILIYDLGQLAGAEYADNPQTIIPGVVYSGTSGNLNVASVPVIADYRAREVVFIDNLETLEATYRKLQVVDADPLGIGILSGASVIAGVNSSNANWKNSGLVLSDEELSAENFGIGSPVYNYSFFLTDAFANPITAEPDPEAEIVAFTPGANDKYFLLPCYYFVFASNSKEDSPSRLQYLNYFYRALPRAPAVDPLNEFYGTGLAGAKNWFNGNSLAAYNNSLDSAKVARSLPNARLFEAVGSGSSWAWTPGNPASGFDNPAYSSLYPIYPDGNFAHSAFNQLDRRNSILLAIIKQEDTYYFVWNSADWE